MTDRSSTSGLKGRDAPNDSPIAATARHPSHLQGLLTRRSRRLSALETTSREYAGVSPVFSLFFRSSAPSVYGYYACLGALRLPDVIDAPSADIDFLFSRSGCRTHVLVATGLLARGASLGRVVARDTITRARAVYGDFAAWTLSRPDVPERAVSVALPSRDECYAIGHTGYRVFASRHRPAFDPWVDAICAKPVVRVLIKPDEAATAFVETRDLFEAWEATHATC